jgi:hypothetical protein
VQADSITEWGGDYDFLEIVLDELDAVPHSLGASADEFVNNKHDRFFEYGYDTYISDRQWG